MEWPACNMDAEIPSYILWHGEAPKVFLGSIHMSLVCHALWWCIEGKILVYPPVADSQKQWNNSLWIVSKWRKTASQGYTNIFDGQLTPPYFMGKIENTNTSWFMCYWLLLLLLTLTFIKHINTKLHIWFSRYVDSVCPQALHVRRNQALC